MTEKTDTYSGALPAFAAELRRCRRETGLTQVTLAARAGVNRNTISDAETETRVPKVGLIRLIADGLATDAAGRPDAARATAFYERLMRAAGYTAEVHRLRDTATSFAVDPLAERLERAFGSESRLLTDFIEQAADLEDADRDFMLSVIRWLRSTMPRGAARRRRAVFPT